MTSHEEESTMPATADAVKEIATFLRNLSPRFQSEDEKSRVLLFSGALEETAAELIRLKKLTTALPPEIGDIHDLPGEVLDELSIATSDTIDDQLVTVINAYGGTATLDQILVGLYRKFKVAQKRRFLQNKLYRMPMVWSVPGKKGVYTTEPPEEQSQADPNGEVSLEDILGDASEPVGEGEEDDDLPF